MRLQALCFALTLAASGCSHWTRISPHDPRIRFTGRVERGDSSGPTFSNIGTSVALRVNAPVVRLHMGELPREGGRYGLDHFELVIDGRPAGVVAASAPDWWQTVELEPGEHVVELYKRNEPNVGRAQFLGAEIPWWASLLPAPPHPARRIEIVGDSYSTGAGNLGPGPECPYDSATTDGYRIYGAIAGRDLGAEVHFIAWSGRGVARNYDLTRVATLPQLYERTIPEDPESRWDFARWTPQAVVLFIGNNDFNRPDPDVPAFEQGYFDFVMRIRGRYPDAYFFFAYPNISDEWEAGQRLGTRAREALDRVLERLRKAGVTRLKTFTLALPAPEHGLGCLWHPPLPTHLAWSQRLRELIAGTMGWGDSPAPTRSTPP
jgi:hypothetical protein